jgi:NADH:ubiquinone oxidoreductase subunit 2 (subunit N)
MMAVWRQLPDWIWLVPVLPLLALTWTAARMLSRRAHGDAAEPLTARSAELAALAGLLLLLAIDALALRDGVPGMRTVGWWFSGSKWDASFSYLMDAISLPIATVAALIGWLVTRFSANYLHREKGFHRFFVVLGFFLAGIQIVLLAGNALLAFVGWEMCGMASFLLIGYSWQRPVATANGLFAFVTNRGGDTAFLLSLGFAAAWLGGFEWQTLMGAGALSPVQLGVLVLGFVVAAMAKSAQLPFTPWIARALEGPTPSSAIFYGAIMVHAGVYLLLRLHPLLAQAPDIQTGIIVVGVLTAIFAWLCGLVQTDVKSALIFATVLQVALMFVEIGLGWTTLVVVHLCLHAAWRGWQFLLAPSWLDLTIARPAPLPAWLARRQLLYTAALQRFWVEELALILLVQPTQALARDARRLEEEFIDRALGEPGRGKAVDPSRPLVQADGLPGRALAVVANACQTLENRLLLRGRGGAAEQLLKRLGAYLAIVENLLEQPRYLMMAVMATIVVIL